MDTVRTPVSGGGMSSHTVTLRERARLDITGVLEVVSFDENVIEFVTKDGTMTVDGDELRIVSHNTESGETKIEGRVCGLFYSDSAGDNKKNKKKLFGR